MFGASWDVWKHGHPPIELYGTEGSMRVPDPNFYGGVVETSEQGGDWIAAQHRRDAARHAELAGRRAAPCQLPRARRCRDGDGDPQRQAAPRERRAGAACARGDGGGGERRRNGNFGRSQAAGGFRRGRRGGGLHSGGRQDRRRPQAHGEEDGAKRPAAKKSKGPAKGKKPAAKKAKRSAPRKPTKKAKRATKTAKKGRRGR